MLAGSLQGDVLTKATFLGQVGEIRYGNSVASNKSLQANERNGISGAGVALLISLLFLIVVGLVYRKRHQSEREKDRFIPTEGTNSLSWFADGDQATIATNEPASGSPKPSSFNVLEPIDEISIVQNSMKSTAENAVEDTVENTVEQDVQTSLSEETPSTRLAVLSEPASIVAFQDDKSQATEYVSQAASQAVPTDDSQLEETADTSEPVPEHVTEVNPVEPLVQAQDILVDLSDKEVPE